MWSIVIEEAQIISNEKRVATADLAQHKNQPVGFSKKTFGNTFLYVNLAIGALLIMKNYIMATRTHRGDKI